MVFKAWFSTPERPCAATGKDTSGAYGFFSAFLMILNDHRPTHVALTLDTGAPTFRHELFPQYKAHRPPPDPEILEQFPMVKSIMQAFRVPVLELEGFEADDLIGTLCALAENENIETLIVTNDTDQLQLVSPCVRLLMYNSTAFAGEYRTYVYDVEGVSERYDGLGPEYVPDMKALEGDRSDNIPGVPGVGKKAAHAVLSNFGRLNRSTSNSTASRTSRDYGEPKGCETCWQSIDRPHSNAGGSPPSCETCRWNSISGMPSSGTTIPTRWMKRSRNSNSGTSSGKGRSTRACSH